MNKNSKIYIAGHRGLIGSTITRKLQKLGYKNLILRTHAELDLLNQQQVNNFFAKEKPEYVFLCAAKVGGILANSLHQAEFIYQNIMISTNVINAAKNYKCKKLLNLGSICIYPRITKQPIIEDYLLDGKLEPSNEGYAIAKISAIKMCKYYNEQYGTNFISVMPTNLYGPGDNFNMETGHLLPMLIRRFDLCKLLANEDFAAIKRNLKKYPLGSNIDATINFKSNASIKTALKKIGVYPDKAVL
jgi:GDP-L-fucose synthase